jgi:HSP20 family protein
MISKSNFSVHYVKRSSALGGADVASKAHWIPNTDAYVTDAGMVIKVELAGVRSENLQIQTEGNQFRISGERPDSCRASKCNFLVMEISYGPFESVLELPPGYDLTQAKAAYQNGFLRIDVPLAVHIPSKPTKIAVA